MYVILFSVSGTFFVYIESAIFFLNRNLLTPKMLICDFPEGLKNVLNRLAAIYGKSRNICRKQK